MIAPDRPRLPYPAAFLAAAVLGFPFVAVAVALAAPTLARGQYHTWHVLAANHLVTMGWGTTVAMGALYQLFPAAAGVRRDPRRADALTAVFYIAAVIGLAAGFWTRTVSLIIGSGTVLVVTVLALEFMAWSVVAQRRRWSWPLTYAATALAALLGVTGWGLLMAANWRWQFWKALLGSPGLGIHVPLGLVGWFGLLVAGVSFHLLPRFADRAAPAPRFTAATYILVVSAVVALIAGAAGWRWAARAGLGLLGAGGLLYAFDVRRYISTWRGRSPDITRVHWNVVAAETAVLSAGLLAAALRLLPGDPARWLVAGVTLFLLGWLTLAIMGQVYKVTPFLMWYYRFALRTPAYDVPRLPAPYWPAPGPWALAATALGGWIISGAILIGSAEMAAIGGLLFVVGGLIFSVTIGYSWLPALRRRRV